MISSLLRVLGIIAAVTVAWSTLHAIAQLPANVVSWLAGIIGTTKGLDRVFHWHTGLPLLKIQFFASAALFVLILVKRMRQGTTGTAE